eukprot:348308-Pyramimonas_sp.AAC.1
MSRLKSKGALNNMNRIRAVTRRGELIAHASTTTKARLDASGELPPGSRKMMFRHPNAPTMCAQSPLNIYPYVVPWLALIPGWR